MGYLPEGYEVPKTPSDYTKWELGDNKFRIVGKPTIGYMYFSTENKPVRMKEEPKQEPENLGSGQYGKNQVKHFWAFKVYNFNTGKVELLEITQVSIMQSMESLFQNEDWGSPENYNINVKKTGQAKETRYEVQPSPPSELSEEITKKLKENRIDFKEWFVGGKNVFSKTDKTTTYEMPKDEKRMEENEINTFADGMPSNEDVKIDNDNVPFN